MKVKYPKVLSRNFNKKEAGILLKDLAKGNIPAYLNVILHNQLVLNDKLNKLLVKKKK